MSKRPAGKNRTVRKIDKPVLQQDKKSLVFTGLQRNPIILPTLSTEVFFPATNMCLFLVCCILQHFMYFCVHFNKGKFLDNIIIHQARTSLCDSVLFSWSNMFRISFFFKLFWILRLQVCLCSKLFWIVEWYEIPAAISVLDNACLLLSPETLRLVVLWFLWYNLFSIINTHFPLKASL